MDFFNQWRFSGRITRQLLRRLEGKLEGFYGGGEYIRSGRTNNLLGAAVGLEYEISEDVQGMLDYNFSQNRSNSRFQEYTKNMISVGIKAAF